MTAKQAQAAWNALRDERDALVVAGVIALVVKLVKGKKHG